GVSRDPTIRGARRSVTLTTCNPATPAATYAKFPLTSTLLAKPGILTRDSGMGTKYARTVPVACTAKPLLVMVIVHGPPCDPAKTRPSIAPKLHTVRSLEV